MLEVKLQLFFNNNIVLYKNLRKKSFVLNGYYFMVDRNRKVLTIG